MGNISEMELQNLRHLLLNSEVEIEKYNDFAQQATSQDVKQFFQKSSQSAMQNKQQLLQFLK